MKKEASMREFFFDRLYDLARENRNIVLVSADMGAPYLKDVGAEKFRRELPGQYVETGIAEQNAILVAAGLAHSGKKPYAYAIAPFVTTRVHEFAKLELGVMKLPVTILGVGVGFSYDESGPTHHTTEDIAIMRAIPNLTILSPSDNNIAAAFADITSRLDGPAYIRLDRQLLPQIYFPGCNFEKGFSELKKGEDVCIVSTGNMVHKALEAHEALRESGKSVGVIDLYQLNPVSSDFKDALKKYKKIVSVEEHLVNGGLGSIVSETITDNDLDLRLKRIGLRGYHYLYGGRDNLHECTGLGLKDIVREVKDF